MNNFSWRYAILPALAILSTVVASPSSAATIGPQQCRTLTDSFLEALTYQKRGMEQVKTLLHQNLVILAAVTRLKMQYPDLKEEDLASLRRVAEEVSGIADALTGETDPKVHEDASIVIQELCS
ncbi:hypothetical protein KXR53_17105 [Inquilinus limosus]|uniref:hypothetical protein n=1 Tax=Inquilinus limosus TaxID=171674 RepID=UPI003F15AF15